MIIFLVHLHVNNLLWLGASAYDIYLTCHQKYETRQGKESSANENNEQLDNIEKQLKQVILKSSVC